IMDAWWPRWLRAEFQPALGKHLFAAIDGMNELVNAPNNSGQHLGSAWQAGWYGYAQKDLRTLLGRHVRGRYSRVYCGRAEEQGEDRACAEADQRAEDRPPPGMGPGRRRRRDGLAAVADRRVGGADQRPQVTEAALELDALGAQAAVRRQRNQAR